MSSGTDPLKAIVELIEENEAMRVALARIARLQPETLQMLQKHGIVFDRAPAIPPDPSDWQQVAFAIYVSLCHADSIASQAIPAHADRSAPP